MSIRSIIVAAIAFSFLAVPACSCGGVDDEGDGDPAGGDADDDDATVDDDDHAGDDSGDDSDDDTDDDEDDDTDDDPAPPPDVAIACVDDKEDVYLTPNAGALAAMERGDPIRCAADGEMTREDVESRLANVPGIDVTSGYASYVISYRTDRDPGEAGIGTARLFVPTEPAAGPLPVAVAAHGTAGLADRCAPSKYPVLEAELLLPFVAAGYPVIAPDYAGLGTDGVQGYGNVVDTTHSMLDAARAAIRALTMGSLSGEVIAIGHSQGGGAALGTQVLGAADGAPDLSIVKVVSFAGGWSSGNEIESFRLPNFPISGGAGVNRAVAALALYANFANLFGEASAREGIHPDVRTYIGDAIDTECVFQLTLTLQTPAVGYDPPAVTGELIDPTFRAEVADCLAGEACTARADAYVSRAAGNDRPFDPGGAPILVVAGSADEQQTPRSQACLREMIESDGADLTACMIEGATHFDIVARGAAYAVGWALGAPIPCPDEAAFPSCI
ncbi:alpha/beta fold hydrolase [bacterium]|nr:alpha/beta fold hydrolase [bacterium]